MTVMTIAAWDFCGRISDDRPSIVARQLPGNGAVEEGDDRAEPDGADQRAHAGHAAEEQAQQHA